MALQGSTGSDLWFRRTALTGERMKETGKPGREEAATISPQSAAGAVLFFLS